MSIKSCFKKSTTTYSSAEEKIDFNCVNELTISRKSDLNLKKGIVNYFPGKANMIIFH
jgi:hypothetical protein